MATNKASSSRVLDGGSTVTGDVQQVVLPPMPVTTSTFTAANGKQAVLFGTSGNDSIEGGNGADTLYGGAGDDIITGGKGDDTVIGGLGNDYLYGGGGHDVFSFKTLDDGLDAVCDWSTGDHIDVRALTLNGGQYAITRVDTDGDTIADASLVTVTAPDGIQHDVVVILGCTTITAADFLS